MTVLLSSAVTVAGRSNSASNVYMIDRFDSRCDELDWTIYTAFHTNGHLISCTLKSILTAKLTAATCRRNVCPNLLILFVFGEILPYYSAEYEYVDCMPMHVHRCFLYSFMYYHAHIRYFVLLTDGQGSLHNNLNLSKRQNIHGVRLGKTVYCNCLYTWNAWLVA